MILVVDATMDTENGNVGYDSVDLCRTISIMDGTAERFIIWVATIPKIATPLMRSASVVSGFIAPSETPRNRLTVTANQPTRRNYQQETLSRSSHFHTSDDF